MRRSSTTWSASWRRALREALDDPDQLVRAVALLAGEADELARPGEDGSLLRCSGDVDAAPAPEFEQVFVPQEPQRAEDGVRVHAEDGGEVAGRRQPLPRLRLAVGDRPADLGGDLEIEVGRL